jgi:2-dehydro-3-deoxyphosphogluconate aldolase / (4S)-4-hydroxy-2-oxoglutarate aldolase
MTRAPIDHLIASAVIPVVRTSTDEFAARAVEWLEEAGYTTFEITLSVPGALDLIGTLRRREGFVVGAGTVLTAAEAEACLGAGAQFIVSPVLAEEVLRVCAEAGVPALIAGLTPDEVYRAWRLGASAVKVFPASSAGGPAHVKALRSVFPEIPLFPTGGVDQGNLNAYFDAGADCLGIGGDLVSDAILQRELAADWIARARAYLDVARLHPRLNASRAVVRARKRMP